jgi:predicted dehydrogenase
MNKIRWGVLSTAKIGREKVIPSIQQSKYGSVIAIASRDLTEAAKYASKLGIHKHYGDYEAILEDKEVDAVYIPLPNHLHVPWAIKALHAGKHVLCEKPISLSVEEAIQLKEASDKMPQVKIMEAFMYRFHPQWKKAKQLVDEGAIGELKTIHSHFSYYNDDPDNIRNIAEIGGGGLMDVGCYCISLARFIFNSSPEKVIGTLDYDPQLGIDRIASGILQFHKGTSTFTCATQLTPYQRVNIIGTAGRIEIEIPFNAPPDKSTRLHIYNASKTEEVVFDPIDQYTLQCDEFCLSIIENKEVPTPLNDAIQNMKVIEAILKSAKEERWVTLDK